MFFNLPASLRTVSGPQKIFEDELHELMHELSEDCKQISFEPHVILIGPSNRPIKEVSDEPVIQKPGDRRKELYYSNHDQSKNFVNS
jgi:hypothetical protein